MEIGEGFEVMHALIYRKQSYFLTITDLRMPELDGVETISRLVSIRPNILILVVSALTDKAIADVSTIAVIIVMSLEPVVRIQRDERMVDPRSLGLYKGRFWSSGSQLPVYRIIARVLADPIEDDLQILEKQFGLSSILATWSELRERGEVADSVIPITNAILRKLSGSAEI